MRCKRSFVYVFSRVSQNAISCKLRFRFQSSSLKFSCTFIYSCQSKENHWHPKRIWNSNWKSNRKRKLKQSPEKMLWPTRSWSNFGKRWQRLDGWPTIWASIANSMYFRCHLSDFFGHALKIFFIFWISIPLTPEKYEALCKDVLPKLFDVYKEYLEYAKTALTNVRMKKKWRNFSSTEQFEKKNYTHSVEKWA